MTRLGRGPARPGAPAPRGVVRRARRPAVALSLVVGLALATIAGGPARAGADSGTDPATDLTNQATLLASQIEATSESMTALGQEYDAAELSLQQAQQAAAADTGSLTALRPRVARLHRLIDERAVSDYEASLTGQSVSTLDLHETQQLSVRDRYAADQAEQENSTLDELSAEERTLTRETDAAEQAQADEVAATQQLTLVRAQLEAENAQEVQTLAKVQDALTVLDPGGPDGDAALFPGLPPVSGVAAVAIAFARAQLGKPYLYAAAGPNAYDCSGLVMAAYGFAGVRLPHYSGAQYAMLPHIPLLAMQPGDLVFWGVAGSEHVAIYVGDGRILEAGGTGDDVHIGPIWGHPVGAARVF